ncbi:MAG: hypothetical protein J6N72_03775 [Psychrobacter sp.]|nr:hypothetical protein [Psychrobacter sp.]
MSIFSTSAKIAGIVVAAPMKFLYPKSAQTTGKNLFAYEGRVNSIYCPSCGESHLKLLNNNSVPQRFKENAYSNGVIEDFDLTAYWACPECDFCYAASTENTTPKNSIAEVREFVRNSSKDDLIDESLMMDQNSASIIDNQMKAAYLFFTLAVISTALMLYGVYKGSWFFCITITVFIATFILIGLKWSYRAWQKHTGNLYAEDPKAQFFDWLSNNNPLKRPQ